MSGDEWTWQFRRPAKRTVDGFDDHTKDRITMVRSIGSLR